jgi:hypothetical protein
MLLPLLFALARAAEPAQHAVYLVACSVKPQSMLDVGIAGVMCEFNIQRELLAEPVAAVIVSITNSDQSEYLPYYITQLTTDSHAHDSREYKDGVTAPLQSVTSGVGLRTLIVTFPYEKCTITGTMLVMRVHVGAERFAVVYRQPNACARASAIKRQAIEPIDNVMTGATGGTGNALIVFALVVCVLLCIAALYIENP